MNITIDEEMYATYSGPEFGWLIQGRWGMYLLNKYLFPFTVVPFALLFVALVFHLAALLLILEAWAVKSKQTQTIVGVVAITLPTLAYIYTFSTLSYGIGTGLFCVAFSLYLYTINRDWYRFLVLVPAAFSIAINQGLIPVLISAFLVQLIAESIKTGQIHLKNIFFISLIHVLSFIIYFIIQRGIVLFGNASAYIPGLFSASFLIENFEVVLTRMLSLLNRVYLGDKSIYSIDIPTLGLLLCVSVIGLATNLLRSNLQPVQKILMMLLAFLLLLLPFMGGFLMYGIMSMRFLVGLPTALSGFIMLGMVDSPEIFNFCFLFLAAFCVFKFTVSANHLFAASHLAFQDDRSTASRLILRIDNAISASATSDDIKYPEVVGYLNRPATELIPKAETFGISYFEVDQGSSMRLVLFLQILGLHNLQPLPLEKRVQMIKTATAMPT